MFDGNLAIEAVRARILLQLAEAKLGQRALGLAGSALIILGLWLKARGAPFPPAPAPRQVNNWER